MPSASAISVTVAPEASALAMQEAAFAAAFSAEFGVGLDCLLRCWVSCVAHRVPTGGELAIGTGR